MTLEYTIKTSPDPTNPNEQPEGNTIIDDRLYGCSKLVLTTGQQSYNREQFNKPVCSNTLTSDILSFYNGQIITIQCETSCAHSTNC